MLSLADPDSPNNFLGGSGEAGGGGLEGVVGLERRGIQVVRNREPAIQCSTVK